MTIDEMEHAPLNEVSVGDIELLKIHQERAVLGASMVLAWRLDTARCVGGVKKALGLGIYNQQRETEVMHRFIDIAEQYQVPTEMATITVMSIIAEARRQQEGLTATILPANCAPEELLIGFRQDIDVADQEIATLLGQTFNATRKRQEAARALNLPVYDGAFENNLIAGFTEVGADHGLDRRFLLPIILPYVSSVRGVTN